MSIFEKIKKIFKSFGNKQQLLESPKEMEEESKDKSKFNEEIKFDPNDLLDPRVCQGDNLIPNILKSLGASEQIANNPSIQIVLRHHCKKILEQNGIEISNNFENLTREQIETMKETLESASLLNEKQINDNEYFGQVSKLRKGGIAEYTGISIEPETGNVIIQNLTKGDYSFREYPDNSMLVKISTDEKGYVKCNCEENVLDEELQNFKYNDSYSIVNADGIVMERNIVEYEYTDEVTGENPKDMGNLKKTVEINKKRDEKYPAIVKITDDKGIHYEAINPKDMSELNQRIGPKFGTDHEGRTRLLRFENYEDVEKYCEEYRDEIYRDLCNWPHKRPDQIPTPYQIAINEGTNKLAQQFMYETDKEQEEH